MPRHIIRGLRARQLHAPGDFIFRRSLDERVGEGIGKLIAHAQLIRQIAECCKVREGEQVRVGFDQRRERAAGGIAPHGHVSRQRIDRRLHDLHHVIHGVFRRQRVINVHDGRSGQLRGRRDLRTPLHLERLTVAAPPAARMQRHGVRAVRLARGKDAAVLVVADGHAVRKRRARHGVVHRRPQHHHRGLDNAIRQLRAVIIRLRRAATGPRRAEIRQLIVRVDVRAQLLELLFLAELAVLAANLPGLAFSEFGVRYFLRLLVSHAPQTTCLAR